MKKRDVNLEDSDEHIANQYDNVLEGLQKDAGQNSWDARLTKKGRNWQLNFTYLPTHNILIIEDFGTKGMNDTRWEQYQGLWKSGKAKELDLGARGQGKFIFHHFSRRKFVLTETIDENRVYRFSYGTAGEWDEDKILTDFIPNANPLDHQGTKICILDVKKEFQEELLDYRKFMRYISATWWEIIRNWDVTFIVNFNGVDGKVEPPQFPKVKNERKQQNVKLKGLGEIRKLVLRYCEEDVAEDLRGIAIQRGGMTILRLPISAEEALKKRIYGYCDFDDVLEMELKKIEYPNHCGFRNKKAWMHVRTFVGKSVDDFVQEIRPKKKQKITIKQELIREAISLVNSLVGDYVPEITGGVFGRGSTITRVSTTSSSIGGNVPPINSSAGSSTATATGSSSPPVRIAKFKGNKKKIEYDESLIIDCEIVNSEQTEKTLVLQLKIQHKGGDFKLKPTEYHVQLSSKTRKKINIPLIDFDEKKDKRGEYRATAVLNDDHKKELHKRSFKFYLHQDPPKSGHVFLKDIKFYLGKGTPIEKRKQLVITDKGILNIAWDHPDFENIRTLAGERRQKWRNKETLLYIVKCGVDGAIQKFLELKITGDQIDQNEAREIKYMCDEMYYDAIESVQI